MPLGIIADDVTGATDIASVIRRAGRHVVLTLGVPQEAPPPADAIVVATKTRMAPVPEALATVGAALDFLQGCGATQFYFKYCSTFDSTDEGNIGPITDYLLDRLGARIAVACPSYPTMARTVYQGHLFVGDRLLSESSMRHHPLTPMLDADLVRVLGAQTPSHVGLADLATVEAGADALVARLAALVGEGKRMAIVDAISDSHISTIAEALADTPLSTGGAALGAALCARVAPLANEVPSLPPVTGPVAMLSGSCSTATLGQVAYIREHVPTLMLDPVALACDPSGFDVVIEEALALAARGSFLVASTAAPGQIAAAQQKLGRDAAAASLEAAFARLATRLAEAGVRKFVVAGGETSGAVTSALRISMMQFGEEVAPGVPLAYSLAPEGYLLALKSGNFGDEQFFARAMEAM